MRLGLIADIHEHVEPLKAALTLLDSLAVDRVVVLGDVCETGANLAETCRLLDRPDVVGVWGNHDYGLACDPDEEILAAYAGVAAEVVGRLRPSVEIDGCYFAHVEPWLDPRRFDDIHYHDGLPTTAARRGRLFAGGHRLAFAGHYHRWLHVTPEGTQPWPADGVLRLGEGRHFVVIDAVCAGHLAVLETSTWELRTFRVTPAR